MRDLAGLGRLLREIPLALFAVLLLSGSVARAADEASARTPLQGDERVKAIGRLQARQREVSTLRATVVQRKQHPLLKGEVVTEGTLLFKRPDHVWWEVTKPERTVIVINGHGLVVYHPARQEAERRDLRDDFGSRAAVDFLTAGMSLDVAELEKRFRVDVSQEDGRLVLVLIPRSHWVAQAVASITITQHEGEALPSQIVVIGPKGDRTETSLTRVTVNPPLPEDAFRLRLGPEVRVFEGRMATGESGSGR